MAYCNDDPRVGRRGSTDTKTLAAAAAAVLNSSAASVSVGRSPRLSFDAAPFSKDLMALDLAGGRRSPGITVRVSLDIRQQIKLKAIEDELQEVNDRMKKLNESVARRKLLQQSQKQQQRPDFSAQIQSMDDQMRHMQDLYSRRFSSAEVVVKKEETLQEEEVTEGKAASVDKQMRHMQGLYSRRFSTGNSITTSKQEVARKEDVEHEEEPTETTFDSTEEGKVASTLLGLAHEDIDAPQSPRGSAFKTLLFGRRRKGPVQSLKKAFIRGMDEEIASMREELRELEISGIIPEETSSSRSSRVARTRSGSPSWRSVLRKKSPARKKARNRSPDR